jgi:hypothetical protein
VRIIRTIIALLAILAILVAVPYFAWLTVAGVLDWLSTQQEQVVAAGVAAIGTVLAAVAAVVYSQQRSKSREITEAHRPKKIELYNSFIRTMIDTLIKHKGATTSGRDLAEDEDFKKFFFDFTSQVILWGSPRVIRKYSDFRTHGEKQAGHIVLIVDDLMRAMRKDLGNSNWTLQRGDLIKLLLTDPEKLDELAKKSH